MKCCLLLPGLVVTALTASIQAQVKPLIGIQPSLRYGFGETEYILDAAWYDQEGVLNHLKSQLEFPLDGAYLGLDMTAVWNPASPKPWDSRIAVATNVNDPTGDMTDRDWSTHWTSGGQTFYLPSFPELSSTISSVEGNSLVLSAEIGKVIARRGQAGVRLFAGYRYQHVKHDVVGLSGWQYIRDGDTLTQYTIPPDHYDGVTVIEYEVTFHTPNAGLEAFTRISPGLNILGRAAYAPVFASDRDDHVLRNLESEASISGHGVMGGISMEYLLGRGVSSQTFLTLTGDVLYFATSGTGFQRFYGNDPGTPEDETGDYAGGVPHEINSLQGWVGVQFGVRF